MKKESAISDLFGLNQREAARLWQVSYVPARRINR